MANIRSHFSQFLPCAVSVRAFGKADAFREELNKRSQHYMRANRLRFGMNCWITVRMEVLANMFPTVVAAVSVRFTECQHSVLTLFWVRYDRGTSTWCMGAMILMSPMSGFRSAW
jgi:ABC-type transport system involved in cytochrome bd biosynthesis fused ATPase/permease subunit